MGLKYETAFRLITVNKVAKSAVDYATSLMLSWNNVQNDIMKTVLVNKVAKSAVVYATSLLLSWYNVQNDIMKTVLSIK
jgi:hypothetical protein